MSGKEMVPWGTAIVGDVLSLLQTPGSGFLGKLGDKYLERKQREAAEILIEEIKKRAIEPVDFAESDIDPLIEIIYRFGKAVADGAARENLRLLAQIIAGLKSKKALEPDKFRKWCNILEQLTRDELMVIGKAVAIRRKIVAAGPGAQNDFWQQFSAQLEASGYKNVIFPLCASVSRTGLLLPVSALAGVVYTWSPWLEELGELVDIEAMAAAAK
jgi:hypothetical protein